MNDLGIFAIATVELFTHEFVHLVMKKLLLLFLVFACCSVRLSSADDQSRTIRDQDGKIIGRIDDTANGKTVRDANGQIIGRIEDTANGRVIRDENGKIIGRIDSSPAPKP
jgi:hypothetical protein